MGNVNQFFAENKIGESMESFPSGDTYIDLIKLNIEKISVEFDGEQKTRYKLDCDGTVYVTGITVIKGIKEAKDAGKQFVRVTKTGEGKDTRYTVIPVEKIPQ